MEYGSLSYVMCFFHMHGRLQVFLKIRFQFWMTFSLWPSHFFTINSLLMRAAAGKIASRLFCCSWVRKAKASMHLTALLRCPPCSSAQLWFALRTVQWGLLQPASSCGCEGCSVVRDHKWRYFLKTEKSKQMCSA